MVMGAQVSIHVIYKRRSILSMAQRLKVSYLLSHSYIVYVSIRFIHVYIRTS